MYHRAWLQPRRLPGRQPGLPASASVPQAGCLLRPLRPDDQVDSFGDLFKGYYDDTVYFHTPTHFLPGLNGGWQLDKLREVEIVLTIGDADPFLDNNYHLSRLLAEKQVGHQLHVWEGHAHRAGAWRKMAGLYI